MRVAVNHFPRVRRFESSPAHREFRFSVFSLNSGSVHRREVIRLLWEQNIAGSNPAGLNKNLPL